MQMRPTLLFSTIWKFKFVKLRLLWVQYRGATAGKAPKILPRFWVSIRSYKKQLVKEIWGRILGLAWLKFVVAPLSV